MMSFIKKSNPDSVCYMLQGNTLRLDYLADGRRVRTSAKTYGTPLVFPVGETPVPQEPTSVTEEMRDGELVFRDGRLVELRTEGGWFSLWNDTLSTTQVRPYFYVMDYLGSVRMTVDGITGEVRQSLEYLPSGYVFRSDNYAEQPYMFCGKELVKMHGWNMYDSNARFQHSKQPRFSSIDPLAEKYYNLSPYNYAGNDPVNAADPSGEMLFIYSEDGYLLDISFWGDWASKDGVCVLKNGHLVWGPTFSHNIVCYDFSTFNTGVGRNGKFHFDYYKINDFDSAKSIFEFLSANTNVEWSWIAANYGILNYLSTSHNQKNEGGGTSLLHTEGNGVFKLNRHSHNHTSGIGIPSGLDGEDGDIPFARETEEKYGNKIHFYTYVAGLGLYVEYSSSSQKSDYNNIEIDGGTIGEASVIAKKRK